MKINQNIIAYFKKRKLDIAENSCKFFIMALVIFTVHNANLFALEVPAKQLSIEKQDIIPKEKLVSGTTVNNLNRGGFIAQDEDGWLYYTDIYTIEHNKNKDVPAKTITYAFYKKSSDGKRKINLGSIYPYYLNIQNGWIYYADQHDDRKIYRMKTDGTAKQKIHDKRSLHIQLVNNWIYFLEDNINEFSYYREFNLYKMRPDGTEKTIVIKDADWEEPLTEEIFFRENYFFWVIDDWIYYKNKNSKICRTKTNSTNAIEISSKDIYKFVIVDNWIYFTWRGQTIDTPYTRMNLDGSKVEKIDRPIYFDKYITLDDEKYYYGYNEGNVETEIIPPVGRDYPINILNDYIYYYSVQDGREGLNRVKLNR